MSLNSIPQANRIHIGIFGRQNVGKSSLINAITKQDIAIVSPVKGTTTDPVLKTMEISPLGAVVFVDTPGIDDITELGELRMKKSFEQLRKVDIAILVTEVEAELSKSEKELVAMFEDKHIPYITVMNKSDLNSSYRLDEDCIAISCTEQTNINLLIEKIGRYAENIKPAPPLVVDLICKGGLAVLVTPIDSSAPKGRLILPQQQVIRELIDYHHPVVVIQPEELSGTLELLSVAPALVITDSQAFKYVMETVPQDIPVTSFSILFARLKGILSYSTESVLVVPKLKNGDNILISEGCTHHRQCEDIGSKKIPALLNSKTGKIINYHFTSGGNFPDDLSPYSLIIHCGGCTLKDNEMTNRLISAKSQNIPMTNYGIFLSYANNTLERSLAPLQNKL